MEKFKSRETQEIDSKDRMYILISTATDDVRVVAVGNIEELQELVGMENEMFPIYQIE